MVLMDTALGWLFVSAPFWLIAVSVLVVLGLFYLLGVFVRHKRNIKDSVENKDSMALSTVMGLLALLLGFTFSLALERFDARRALVGDEALAIRTTYLRAGTFAEPARSHLRNLIASYADERVALGSATEESEQRRLSRLSDGLQHEMWLATEAALVGNRDDISSSFMDSMNSVIETDAARRVARRIHIPSRVLGALLFYMAITAGMMGYALGTKRRGEVLLMLGLTTTAYLLIIDIDDATRGGVTESQAAMRNLQVFLRTNENPQVWRRKRRKRAWFTEQGSAPERRIRSV